jgi:chemotaxis protein methyltransferase CheR
MKKGLGETDGSWRLSLRHFRQIASFVQSELGIKMPESKVQMMQGRLARRARELGLASIEAYCALLFSPNGAERERVHLIDAVTTNKTDFFREPGHFEYLTRTVLPELERSRKTSASFWSAACSSGEEPYTLAMVLSEFGLANPGFSFQILATDISTKMLEAARHGIYTESQVEPVPSWMQAKYLMAGKGERAAQRRIVPALRKTVSFHRLNLMRDHYGVKHTFDVIFCRNVLIYFDRPTQEAVVNKLCKHLRPGGYLFIGHSESVSGLHVPLTPAGAACLRKTGGGDGKGKQGEGKQGQGKPEEVRP